MKKIIWVAALCLIIAPSNAQQNKEDNTLVSIDFENQKTLKSLTVFAGKDSVVEGIKGDARYFSGSAEDYNHILN
jgi:hypothetical protein